MLEIHSVPVGPYGRHLSTYESKGVFTNARTLVSIKNRTVRIDRLDLSDTLRLLIGRHFGYGIYGEMQNQKGIFEDRPVDSADRLSMKRENGFGKYLSASFRKSWCMKQFGYFAI